MKASTLKRTADPDSEIQEAIFAYNTKQQPSIRKAANAFKVPFSIVQARIAGRSLRSMARELQQILSNVEENILVRWITRLTITGYPASPKLVLEMAEEIRRECVFLVL